MPLVIPEERKELVWEILKALVSSPTEPEGDKGQSVRDAKQHGLYLVEERTA